MEGRRGITLAEEEGGIVSGLRKIMGTGRRSRMVSEQVVAGPVGRWAGVPLSSTIYT
jgi:hypothetical protein